MLMLSQQHQLLAAIITGGLTYSYQDYTLKTQQEALKAQQDMFELQRSAFEVQKKSLESQALYSKSQMKPVFDMFYVNMGEWAFRRIVNRNDGLTQDNFWDYRILKNEILLSYLSDYMGKDRKLQATMLAKKTKKISGPNFARNLNWEAAVAENRASFSMDELTLLVISQKGKGFASSVSIEMDRVKIDDLFIERHELRNFAEKNTTRVETIKINLGNFDTGSGIIVPIYMVLRGYDSFEEVKFYGNSDFVNGVFLIPRRLTYKNELNETVETVEIRDPFSNSIFIYTGVELLG